jgi:peroxiredoxin
LFHDYERTASILILILTVPDFTFQTLVDGSVVQKTTAEVFDGKKVALFAVPGAFTPG